VIAAVGDRKRSGNRRLEVRRRRPRGRFDIVPMYGSVESVYGYDNHLPVYGYVESVYVFCLQFHVLGDFYDGKRFFPFQMSSGDS
jgi:hypothetical protein